MDSEWPDQFQTKVREVCEREKRKREKYAVQRKIRKMDGK
jgi:hypothetical protein